MSLRNWLLACIAGLGAALPIGCVSSPVDPTLNPRAYVPDLPNLRAHGPTDSPYHQQPDPDKLPPEVIQRPTQHAEPPPLKAEPPAAPPSPSGQPPAPADASQSARVVPPAPDHEGKPPEQQSNKTSAPPDEPLVAALRAYLRKRPIEAMEALSRYDKANQDMMLVALPFAARLTEGSVNVMDPREAAELADVLQGVEDRLRQRAALRIEKMLFVRKIDDFGVYVAREPVNGIHTFEGGAGDQVGEEVLVYLELRNVSSRQNGDRYETRLAGTVELLDNWQGQSAYRKDFSPPPHVGRSPRHDFFVKCSFSVPRRVPPGRYTMRIEIRDITGLPPDSADAKAVPPKHRAAAQTLDLQVIVPRPDRVTAGR
jgi:hypothetical protein